ncbi:MAG TPA: DUF6259 domain-containing protein [Candidatus Paceibacterota bacterium]|nr:DUF6259 domain-containing protein [Verrucomicrobiota bacterium]HRY48164.1 DUF6259 domain-containing protein [Candidatus Paceibacterota bacterium]
MVSRFFRSWLLAIVLTGSSLEAAQQAGRTNSTWPQAYSVQQDNAAGLLTLSTPYYQVWHDLKRGGGIAGIRLVHGRSTNLLIQPIVARIRNETGALFADWNDAKSRISRRRDDLTEIVTIESRLLDERKRESGIQLKTVYEYHWGYIKIRREFTCVNDAFRALELCPLFTVLIPSLSEYGFREGTTEKEGVPPFAFGSNRWGKTGDRNSSAPFLDTPHIPRSILVADPGIEGLEWFQSSDLWQWDSQLTGNRGQGRCWFESSRDSSGLVLSISPLHRSQNAVVLPKRSVFDFYLGIPILEGHASRPWFHASFNRNRGEWVSNDQIQQWARSGIQTVHCHNDGDYYHDGLFWRDGSYPPYPDMTNYDRVITGCQQAGIRVATYFSNKELHPSTPEFLEHGQKWARKDSQGKIQHNFYRGTNEFGVQMCLKSGWLDFLKRSIDRVLKNHPLNGVYYDWNVPLHCYNGLHGEKRIGEAASGHWDIDELLDLMEWTRRRVGPSGLVIVHNTTTPMFALENFSDHVVANEWGYGKWKEPGPDLRDLPLEWSLVGARSRGVISYGQLDAQSPRRLHRLFAMEALLAGVTPWPANAETLDLFSVLKPLGDIEAYRFLDWRNEAVILKGARCASAVYSKPGMSYIILANLEKTPQEIGCVVRPAKLPCPLSAIQAAVWHPHTLGNNAGSQKKELSSVEIARLTRDGIQVTIPGDGAVLLEIR